MRGCRNSKQSAGMAQRMVLFPLSAALGLAIGVCAANPKYLEDEALYLQRLPSPSDAPLPNAHLCQQRALSLSGNWLHRPGSNTFPTCLDPLCVGYSCGPLQRAQAGKHGDACRTARQGGHQGHLRPRPLPRDPGGSTHLEADHSLSWQVEGVWFGQMPCQ